MIDSGQSLSVRSDPNSKLPPTIDKQKLLWAGIRASLLMALGAIEDYLGYERSVKPKRR
jgi:hypothetical protein